MSVRVDPPYVYADCGCGYDIVFTPEGWQHDAAPYFWGEDHDPNPDEGAIAAAAQMARTNPEYSHWDLIPWTGGLKEGT